MGRLLVLSTDMLSRMGRRFPWRHACIALDELAHRVVVVLVLVGR